MRTVLGLDSAAVDDQKIATERFDPSASKRSMYIAVSALRASRTSNHGTPCSFALKMHTMRRDRSDTYFVLTSFCTSKMSPSRSLIYASGSMHLPQFAAYSALHLQVYGREFDLFGSSR